MPKDVLIVAVGSINADLVAEKSVTAQRANYAYGSNFEMNLGGKSLNVALTALALSNDVALISRIGNDIFGLEILNKAMKDGLITQYITIDEQAHTGIGHVRVDENGQYDTIVINGANWNLTEEDIDAFISDGYRPKFVAKVKNTVGAGDGFLACLIYSIAQELSLEQSLINATYVGKIICSKSEASLSAKDVLVLNSEPSFIRKIKTTLSSKG